MEASLSYLVTIFLNPQFNRSFPISTNRKRVHAFCLKQVDDPQRYGVASLNGNRIESIEEKPEHPKSNYAVVGVYLYDSSVFEIIRTIEPSSRGEYEITAVNNVYIARGQLEHSILQGGMG